MLFNFLCTCVRYNSDTNRNSFEDILYTSSRFRFKIVKPPSDVHISARHLGAFVICISLAFIVMTKLKPPLDE